MESSVGKARGQQLDGFTNLNLNELEIPGISICCSLFTDSTDSHSQSSPGGGNGELRSGVGTEMALELSLNGFIDA